MTGPQHICWFHLHILVFPFVYQFNSRIVALICSSFANDYIPQKDFNIILASFQNLLVVVFTWKRITFTLTSFAVCIEMRWMFVSSTTIWVTGSVEWTRIWTRYLECRWNNPIRCYVIDWWSDFFWIKKLTPFTKSIQLNRFWAWNIHYFDVSTQGSNLCIILYDVSCPVYYWTTWHQ